MANIDDVVKGFLDIAGPLTAMKLQKLVYYAQAWSLVWDETPLFENRIEAWANGPVVVDLYKNHAGMFLISNWQGDANNLTAQEASTVKSVWEHYGKYTAQQLSDLTHSEAPWLEARAGLLPSERGSKEITHASLSEYYSGI